MRQRHLLWSLLEKNPRAVFICSLGTISYDVEYILAQTKMKREVHLIRGAMGCALGIGLGYALNSRKRVIVLVGDGSFMMKYGSMVTAMKYHPKNLKVYIFNNRSYQSTGGQDTTFEALRNIEYLKKHFHIYGL